ncbi:MAG: UvrD-helicase domain-containing protein [Clostridiales bacterium]|nr:UvrD-helicase domain-containing protein [Clostridiales bacterium]
MVNEFVDSFSSLHNIFVHKNEEFLITASSTYNDLFSDIDGKSLDDQQRCAVLTDEDHNLVLAGAGSGKTLTIAGKVKYLCDVVGIKPSEILLIAFTRKSAEEMTERISNKLGIGIEATTFHKLGLDIIKEARSYRPDIFEDLGGFISNFFEEDFLNQPQLIRCLIEYFAYYLNIPADMSSYSSLGEMYEHEKAMDFETIQSKYEKSKYADDEAQSRKENKQTLAGEYVKSLEEVSIANFLFLNGVNYEYESLYPYESDDPMRKAYRPDFYLPDYDIYLEHFGIDKNNRLPWLSPIEEEKYLDGIQWKRAFHKQNGTKLIETYSYYSSEGRLIDELDALLKKNGVKYVEPDFFDIFDKIYAKQGDKYFSEFIKLCQTFITLFKSNGYKIEDLRSLSYKCQAYKNDFFVKRTQLFLSIIEPILRSYEDMLCKTKSIDFSDMINLATDIVSSGFQVAPYKYVIIDEFQDISVARYKLVKAILDQTNAKLLCVGDDWQSIYRFTGSDISLFTNFESYFGYTKVMRIEKTYRNSQQLIDEVGKFITQNPMQLNKSLRSDKSLEYPLVFWRYSDNPFIALKRVVSKIISEFGEEKSILFLGRTTYDFEMLKESGLFTVKGEKIKLIDYPNTPVEFLTVHKSKGLEADNVVLLNFKNAILGFPNKISDDPILELVLSSSDAFIYAEERRLLYVALTRTKNRSYVLVDESSPSEFFREFNPSNSVFISNSLLGKPNEDTVYCPRCKTGRLIVRKNESTNQYFVGCSNFPQCDYSVKQTSILMDKKRCPYCGGFLVKRKGPHGFFWGCTNYPNCRFTAKD